MVAGFSIGGRPIGAGQPCFVIAEAGVNHDGDLAQARQLIAAAAASGAEAVKFQTFVADRLATAQAPMARYQKAAIGDNQSQLEMLRRLELSTSDHRQIIAMCRDQGIMFLSSPFDAASADLLEALDVPAFKIASGEITNLPLLAHIAAKRRPIILSTGMSTLADVQLALDTIYGAGHDAVALLHCVSRYPALPHEVNLRAMRTLADRFQVPVGYSDHSREGAVAAGAVALGASILEKHITTDCRRTGPDHSASIEPDAFAQMVRDVRIVEAALGSGQKEPVASEAEVAAVARRSLVAAKDIPEGAVLTDDLLECLRPGTGLPPSRRVDLVGKIARQPIAKGTMLSLEMVQ